MPDLVKLLRAVPGLKVVDSRVDPAPGAFAPKGVMNHHTASRRLNLSILQHGRSDLPGPLCNIGIDTDGTVHVVTDGRANDSGKGSIKVLSRVAADQPPLGDAHALGYADDTNGNEHFYDIEVVHPGDSSPYPDVQLEALFKVNAALCAHHDWTANRCIHHREWTRRKIDMSWRGDLRGQVAALLQGDLIVATYVAGKRGTPDYQAAAWACDAAVSSGIEALPTSNLSLAKRAAAQGNKVLAVGGPAAEALKGVAGVTPIVGADALDTGKKLVDALRAA